jgi:hypothetical protein
MNAKRDPKAHFDKVTLNLRKGDADHLSLWFPEKGYSAVIREIVAAFVERTRAKQAAGSAPVLEETNV